MYDLKPCPFCGGKVSLTYHSGDNVYRIWHHWGNSAECFIAEPIELPGNQLKSLSEAAQAWNRRQDDV